MRSTRFAAQSSEDLESPFLDREMTPRFKPWTRADETRATASSGESPRGSEEEILDSRDDRTLVTDTLKRPHGWICAIDVMSENPKWGTLGQPRYECRSRATGTLIGPRYVLTAAHVFGDDRQKALTLATVHDVSPARSGDNAKNPFGAIKSTAIRFPQPYRLQRTVRLPNGNLARIPIHHPGDDYALLILEKDVSMSTHANMKGTLGYWGEHPRLAVVKRLDPVALQNQHIIVVGYPGDTCGRSRLSGSRSEKNKKIEYCWRRRNHEWASTQWRSEGTVTVNADANLVFHTADTYDGQSGSPLGLYVDRVLHLAAIHTGPDNAERNKGTPVTLRMLQEVSAWINTDAGYEAATIQDETLTIRPQSSRPREGARRAVPGG